MLLASQLEEDELFQYASGRWLQVCDIHTREYYDIEDTHRLLSFTERSRRYIVLLDYIRFDFDALCKFAAKACDAHIPDESRRRSFGWKSLPLEHSRLVPSYHHIRGCHERRRILHRLADIWLGGSQWLVQKYCS